VKKRSEILRSGVDYPNPSLNCWPMMSPYIFRVQEMQVLQKKDEVVFLFMQDHQVRRIRLNSAHPAKLIPSWQGDSIGHYEGDTLVIDTVGIRTRPGSMIDMYGTPHTPALHVIERYRLVDGKTARVAQESNEREYGRPTTEPVYVDFDYQGKGLQAQFTVEDAGSFTRAWGSGVTYRRATSPEWLEIACAENVNAYYGGATATVPRAEKPDF